MDSRPIAPLLAALLSCGACEPAVTVCPRGTVADPERARALLDLARSTPAGQALAQRDLPICFGALDRGNVRPDGVVVLPDSSDREALAARMTHLGLHVVDGLHRFPAADTPCDRQIAAAMAAEARAIVGEITACDDLRCAAPPYSFAAEVLAAAPAGRVDLVTAKLHAEPHTDGLDVVVRGYRTRCADANPHVDTP